MAMARKRTISRLANAVTNRRRRVSISNADPVRRTVKKYKTRWGL